MHSSSPRWVNVIVILLLLLVGVAAATCSRTGQAVNTSPDPQQNGAAVSDPLGTAATAAIPAAEKPSTKIQSSEGEDGRDGLLLSGAFFKDKKPLPARTMIARPPAIAGEPWTTELIECGDKSNVFQKAMAFQPVNGAPGIMTISGAKAGEAPAQLKIWRKTGTSYEGELVYSGVFGGKFDRLRDVEVGDVNGDQSPDIVVVTHQRGTTLVIEQKDGRYETTKVVGYEQEGKPVWIHEVEIGDVDGDGLNEFFSTPSEPNNLDGKVQPGDVMMYKYVDGRYQETLIEHYPTRHAKEILCYDLEKTGRPQVYASIEGETIGAAGGASTLIRVYRWQDGKMTGADVMPLPGKLCRFLVAADTDGDGNPELIASTKDDGIYCLYREDGDAWTQRLVVDGATSKGFEHATTAFDWDQDGKDDVFAVSDDLKVLRRFTFDPTSDGYTMEKLLDIPAESMFVFNIERLPAGM